jgi:hypothetical protein
MKRLKAQRARSQAALPSRTDSAGPPARRACRAAGRGQGLQSVSEAREQLSGGQLLLPRRGPERAADGVFHGAFARPVRGLAGARQREPAAAGVDRIPPPLDEASAFESADDACQSTGMKVQLRGQLTGGNAGEPAYEPESEPLRPREPNGRLHPLRDALQLMIHSPQPLHESKDRVDLAGGNI